MSLCGTQSPHGKTFFGSNLPSKLEDRSSNNMTAVLNPNSGFARSGSNPIKNPSFNKTLSAMRRLHHGMQGTNRGLAGGGLFYNRDIPPTYFPTALEDSKCNKMLIN
jgi:hypothetical protein